MAERLRIIRPRAQPVRASEFRLLAVLFALGYLCLLVTLVATSSPPSGVTLFVLIAFAIAATHRETLFGDETAMTASIVVIVASIVAFQDDAAILGPVLCSALAGIHVAQVRDHSWSKIIVNSSATGLAAAAGAALFELMSNESSAWSLVGATIAAIVAYWLVNNIMIGSVLAAVSGVPTSTRVLELIRSETEMLVFALAGALCGILFFEVGTWAGALALAAVLVAVDVMVVSRPHPTSVQTKHPGLAAVVGRALAFVVAATGAWVAARWITAIVGLPVGVVAGLLVTTFVALGLLRRRLQTWELSMAAGVAVADAPYSVVAGCAGTAAAAVGVSAGLIVAVLGGVVVASFTGWRRRRSLGGSTLEDARAFVTVERALLDRPVASSR